MRNRVVCDECEKDISFWAKIYKTTYEVTVVSSLASRQHHDFCSMKCLLKYYEARKYREAK